jgi:hypothetical protein
VKQAAIDFGFYLLRTAGIAFQASVATAAVILTARYFKVFWM